MSDWIGLAVIGLVVACGLFGLSHLGKPYDLTAEEYERRAQEGPGLLGAGLVGIQKALDPGMERAVEVQEDFRQGHYDAEQETGEPPEVGNAEPNNEANNLTPGEDNA